MLAVGVVASAAVAQAELVIDDFTEGPTTLTADTFSPGTTQSQSGLSPTAVLGGLRSIYVGRTFNPDPTVEPATFVVDTATASASLTTPVGELGYLTLSYLITPGARGTLDLTTLGDRFEIEFVAIPDGLFRGIYEVEILVLDNGVERTESVSFASDLFGLTESSGTIVVPFSAFDEADLERVLGIRLDIVRAEPATTIGLGSFRVVPEPGVLALGLIGVAWLLRRSARAAG